MMVPTFQHWRRDLPRSRRPKLWNIENIRRLLEANSQKSTRRLSEELGASKDTIHRQIKTLGKSYRSCRSVPHELTPQQDQRRLNISHLIGNTMDDIFFRRIVTCDEKWVYNRNPEASKQCLGSHQPAKVIVKKIGSAPK